MIKFKHVTAITLSLALFFIFSGCGPMMVNKMTESNGGMMKCSGMMQGMKCGGMMKNMKCNGRKTDKNSTSMKCSTGKCGS